MISEKNKQTIKLTTLLSIVSLLLIFVAILMIKYEVEGETNMPFKLSKIIVVGTVEGIEKDKSKLKWDFDIYQNNDIHFYIDENKDARKPEDLLIKSVKIENIQITKEPLKGEIKTYMPNSEAGRLFVFDDQFLVDQKLEYKGASQSSTTNLQIGSKGGTALIRFSNINLGAYSSNKDKQIVHDASLLKKIKATNEEISFSVSFDFIIETTKGEYKANINLDLPTGQLGEEKNCYLEITDMSNIIFKRTR